jgi:thiol-disulfide isomerase/thioredoxin
MRMLFGIYDRSDPGRALALAQEMETARGEDWGQFARYEEQMISAKRLLRRAMPILPPSSYATSDYRPTPTTHTRLILLRAQAADTNLETQSAYEGLLQTFASDRRTNFKLPSAPMLRNSEEVRANRRPCPENKKPATPFTLSAYGEPKQVSLSDFKGRGVLLNSWFPGCNPCREEFPYLRPVFEKGFSVIAVNIMLGQDDLVLSALKGNKLHFIPVRDDEKVSRSYAPEGFAPANFLIGPDGRSAFIRSFLSSTWPGSGRLNSKLNRSSS